MAYQNQKVKARQVVTPNSQTQDLGIVSGVPMGEWNTTTQYNKLNTVRYNGATYIAKKQNQGIEPTVTVAWQEVWQVVAYDGGSVEPTGTYPDMTVGNATNATNDSAGNNIAEQFETIESYIPSSTSADNPLTNQEFVNSSINNMAAFYITYNAQGAAFPTRASLLSATTYYYGGQVRTPTQNDYAIVLADESQPQGVDGKYPTTRYSYQGLAWSFQYVVNNTSLTQAQVDAINSGITKELVEEISGGSDFNPSGNYPNLTAGKATNDSDGKKISTTYAKQTGTYPNMTVGNVIYAPPPAIEMLTGDYFVNTGDYLYFVGTEQKGVTTVIVSPVNEETFANSAIEEVQIGNMIIDPQEQHIISYMARMIKFEIYADEGGVFVFATTYFTDGSCYTTAKNVDRYKTEISFTVISSNPSAEYRITFGGMAW